MIFECFTTADDDSTALSKVNNIDPYDNIAKNPINLVKKFMPQRVKNVIKAVAGR